MQQIPSMYSVSFVIIHVYKHQIANNIIKQDPHFSQIIFHMLDKLFEINTEIFLST